MIGNFKVMAAGSEFDFHTVNALRLHLFQVYVIYEGKKVRCHMQRRNDHEFYITDPDKVPGPFKGLQTELSEAIFDYGKSIDQA